MTQPALTPEQAEVVRLGPDKRALVTAPAGTGKTRTLVDRLTYLTEAEGLSGTDELLLLTFTRSAARILRDRVRASDSAARVVRASTFDSFASRLLADEEPEGRWKDTDYDARIKEAAELLGRSRPQRLRYIRHVLVDEVQDLVGIRGGLVQALLAHLDAGFTLFGDPAQAIFDFQLTEEERRHSPQRLVDWVRRQYGPDLLGFTFTLNFRAETAATKAVLPFGAPLAEGDKQAVKTRFALETAALKLESADPIQMSIKELAAGSETLAILARTNGEVLLLSRGLFEAGVVNTVQRRATDRVVPGWIAVALCDLPHHMIGKTAFLKRLGAMAPGVQGLPEPSEAWRLLKRVDRRRTDDLDIPALNSAIRSRVLPDEILDAALPAVTLSTVHRAKGMEFSSTVIALPFPNLELESEAQLAEETRVLYVALTRARRNLCRIAAPGGSGLYCLDQDRWMIKQFRGRGLLLPTDFELRGDDLHDADPVGLLPIRQGNARELQEYLATHVRHGDALEAELLSDPFGPPTQGRYAVFHMGTMVGLTGERFSQSLYYALKPKTFSPKWRVRWPDRMSGFRVEAVDTVAGTPATSDRAMLGSSGMWLRVRPFGLATFHFKRSEA